MFMPSTPSNFPRSSKDTSTLKFGTVDSTFRIPRCPVPSPIFSPVIVFLLFLNLFSCTSQRHYESARALDCTRRERPVSQPERCIRYSSADRRMQSARRIADLLALPVRTLQRDPDL